MKRKNKKTGLLLVVLLSALGLQAQTPVWNGASPFNFQDAFEIDAPAEFLDYYVTDNQGNKIKVPEAQETEYWFNLDGREEWGDITISCTYNCGDGEEVPTNPGEIDMNVFDLGLYAIGGKNKREKWYPDSVDPNGNPYFDPSKRTVVYVHGWNPLDPALLQREVLLNNFNESMVDDWNAEGWNVMVYYWNQIADLDNPIEALYRSVVNYYLEYLEIELPDGFPIPGDPSPPTGNLSQAFAHDLNLLRQIIGNEVELRVVGHSVGAQLAVQGASLMTEKAPERVALLTPWFSAEGKDIFGQSVDDLIVKEAAIEWYDTDRSTDFTDAVTSYIQGAIVAGVAAANGESELALLYFYKAVIEAVKLPGIRLKTAYTDLEPYWINNVFELGPFELPNLIERHNAAVVHYFESIRDPQPVTVHVPRLIDQILGRNLHYEDDNGGQWTETTLLGINAASCIGNVKKHMQYPRTWQIGGRATVTSSDDIYRWEEDLLNPAITPPPRRLDQLDQAYGNGSSQAVLVANNALIHQREFNYNLGAPNAYRELENDYHLWNTDFILSYNASHGTANWTGWHYNKAWQGIGKRKPEIWRKDMRVPDTYPQAFSSAYDNQCEFTRGHLVPNADRKQDAGAPNRTNIYSNILPQNARMNDQKWNKWEILFRDLAEKDYEIYRFAGRVGIGGYDESGNKIDSLCGYVDTTIPEAMWMAVIIIPEGVDDVNRINQNGAIAFAVHIPNKNPPLDSKGKPNLGNDTQKIHWLENKLRNVDGKDYNFFPLIDPTVAQQLKEQTWSYNALKNLPMAYASTQENIVNCGQIVFGPGFSRQAGTNVRAYIHPECNGGTEEVLVRTGQIPAEEQAQQLAPAQQDAEEAGMTIYPNPTSGILYLSFYQPHESRVQVKLYDMSGNQHTTLIDEQLVTSGQRTLKADLSHVPNGMYLVRLTSQGGKAFIERVIKIAHGTE